MFKIAAALVLATTMTALGGGHERWAVVGALAALALRRRTVAAVLLGAALLALAGHLMLDHHAYRLVWLYGGAETAWLRLAGLWAGDEATLLALAVGTAALPGGGIAAAAFAVGALVWDPFAQVAGGVRPAPNPHLQTVWMLVHPPLILAAYALLLAKTGAALTALGGTAWQPARHGRLVWALLGLGLLTGMAWAYEDFTFAPLWHWDPVQSAVFVVWALVTAMLHARGLPRLQPLLWLLACLAALLAMAATRHGALASSHRYVGDTSLPLLLAMAAGLAGATAWAWRRSRAMPGKSSPLLKLAIAGLGLCAALVLGELAWAGAAQALGVAKPEAARPYYAMLARWAPAEEMAALDAAFARWEPNVVGLDALLLPPAIALALVAGHKFMPAARWPATILAAMAAALLAWFGGPFVEGYRGTGMTASGTVEALPWLDALLAALAYCVVALLAWTVRRLIPSPALREREGPAKREGEGGAGNSTLRRGPHPNPLPQAGEGARIVLVAVAHLGTAVGLAAFLAATVFDSYAQKVLRWPDDAGRPVALPDGFTVTVRDDAWNVRDGQTALAGPIGAEPGPVRGATRVICEILDYRYARYASGKAHLLSPAIDRGLWRDVQVWVGPAEDRQLPIVVKTYPLVAWVWIGFGAAALSGLGLAALNRDKEAA